MSYQFIPNIIFLVAVLIVLVLILRRLPEIKNSGQTQEGEMPIEKRLAGKGLPALAISKLKTKTTFYLKKVWQFVLEAKGLRPHGLAGYKIKKIFIHRSASENILKRQTQNYVQGIKDEEYYLEQIKLEPRKLEHYDNLGKFYLNKNNFSEAKDIYLYLINHEPANGNFHARLAYCFFQLDDFPKSAKHYETSLSLDSAHPNRYYNLGLSLAALNDFVGAVKNYEQAILLEPGNANYHLALSKARQALGEAEEAKK